MTTYSKLKDGSWGLRGHGLVEGQVVEVTKKDGATSTELVGHVLWTGEDGICLAKIESGDSEATADAAPKAKAKAPVKATPAVGGTDKEAIANAIDAAIVILSQARKLVS